VGLELGDLVTSRVAWAAMVEGAGVVFTVVGEVFFMAFLSSVRQGSMSRHVALRRLMQPVKSDSLKI
jgi:hypothetical protein